MDLKDTTEVIKFLIDEEADKYDIAGSIEHVDLTLALEAFQIEVNRKRLLKE